MNIDKKLELAHEYAVTNNSYSSDAWAYADAMEAEYNKRKQQQEVEGISQDVGLLDNLNLSNSKPLDWQPDWSVAPENTEGWKANPEGTYSWTERNGGHIGNAPSFNYQGDWKDSLRKRPK